MPRRRSSSEESDESSEIYVPRRLKKGVASSINEISANNRGRKIRVFRNGDTYYPGKDYTVSGEKFATFETFLDHLTRTMDVRWPVHYLYNLEGKQITNMEDLTSDESYVAANQKGLIRINYGSVQMPIWRTTLRVHEPLALAPIESPGVRGSNKSREKSEKQENYKKKKEKKNRSNISKRHYAD